VSLTLLAVKWLALANATIHLGLIVGSFAFGHFIGKKRKFGIKNESQEKANEDMSNGRKHFLTATILFRY
jgi:hypothetical protein